MKKGLAALAAACFLFVGTGKAQAVVGIPDDVPGATLLFPFFKVNPNRTAASTLDTLLVVTNTANTSATVHFTIWTVESVHAYDFNVTLTAHDVFACALYDILLGDGCDSEGVLPAPPAAAATLTTTINGRTLLAGYATADLVTTATSQDPILDNLVYPFRPFNILIGHEYVVDLPAGSAGGFNATSIEEVFPVTNGGGGHPTGENFLFALTGVVNFGFYGPADTLERIDGNSGVLAQTGASANGVGDDDDLYDLIVRYFTADSLDIQTELWVWKETDADSYNPVLAVYDEEENVHSISQPFPDEVNFVNVHDIITPGAPGGWFRIPMPESEQAVGDTVQLAHDSTATLRWDAIFPAHRQYTDYIGGDTAE
jgi:hypothetical protein